MKRILLLLTLFTLGTQTIFAQKKKAKSFAAEENALLWKIEGKKMDDSYLYGTIHMIDSKDFFLTPSTEKTFKECERVTFEINMEDMTDMSAQFSLLMSAFMEGGTTLKTLLSAEDYKVVEDHFSEIGLPLMFLERIKPMFLSVLASEDMGSMMGGMTGEKTEEDEDVSSIKSYEMEFMEMAKSQEKEMAGLETMEFQMSMFDSIPYKAQADMLVETIQASGEEGSDQLDEMVKMYKAQDLKAMEKMIAEGDEGLGEFAELLLNNRNRNWIPIMEEQMKEKSTFFAVGAGHLGGEVGVVALLREAGYKVTAVDPVKP